MPDNNSILEKLEGLESRYEEISTLITDPSVIADQKRYVRLTREYKDLDDIMKARKKYIACLGAIKEAKDILANESDPDLKDMAREELQSNEALQPKIEEEIKKSPLCRKIPRTQKMYRWRFALVQEATRRPSSRGTCSRCTKNSATRWDGYSP